MTLAAAIERADYYAQIYADTDVCYRRERGTLIRGHVVYRLGAYR